MFKTKGNKPPKVKSYQKRDRRIRILKHWTAFLWQGMFRQSSCRIGFHMWSKYAEPKTVRVEVGKERFLGDDYKWYVRRVYEDWQMQYRICHCCHVLNKKRFHPS